MVEGILLEIGFEVSCCAMAMYEVMRLLRGGGICPRTAGCSWNYCIDQDAFAQPGAEVCGGDFGIAGEAKHTKPEPGAKANVEDEGFGSELAIANEARHCRQFEIQRVGNGLDREKREVFDLSGAGDGSCFHVNGVGAVVFCELLLLSSGGDLWGTDEYGPS